MMAERKLKKLFEPLPDKQFDVIYADPPWNYRDGGKTRTGAAERYYPTLTLKQLGTLPVETIANRNCALLMWTTGPKMDEALELMKLWGFVYKTIFFNWVKTTPSTGEPKCGLGNYTRSSTEICLLGVRGNVCTNLKKACNVQQTILSPAGRHSEKPLEAKERIEAFFGPKASKIELFSRTRAFTPLWTVWGNEAVKNESSSSK